MNNRFDVDEESYELMNEANNKSELSKTVQARELQAQKEAEERKKKEEEKQARRKKLIMAAKLVAAAAAIAGLIALIKKVNEKNKENKSKEANQEAEIVQEKLEELLGNLNEAAQKAKTGKMTNEEYDEAMSNLSLAKRYQQTIPSIVRKRFGSNSDEYQSINKKLKPKTENLEKIRNEIADGFIPAGKKKNMSQNVRNNAMEKQEKYKKMRNESKEKKDRYQQTTGVTKRIKNYMTYDLSKLRQDRKNGTFYDKNSVDDSLFDDLFNDELLSNMTESQMDLYVDCWNMLIEEAKDDMCDMYNQITSVITEKAGNGIISADKALDMIESASQMYLID